MGQLGAAVKRETGAPPMKQQRMNNYQNYGHY